MMKTWWKYKVTQVTVHWRDPTMSLLRSCNEKPAFLNPMALTPASRSCPVVKPTLISACGGNTGTELYRIEFCQVKSQHTEQYRTRTNISLANRLELWISTLHNLNSFLSLLEVLHAWWTNWDKTDPWVLDSPNAKRRALIEKPPSKSCSAEYPQSLSSPREKPASLKS